MSGVNLDEAKKIANWLRQWKTAVVGPSPPIAVKAATMIDQLSAEVAHLRKELRKGAS